MAEEKTIVIPKKALQWGILVIVVLIAVVLAAPLFKSTPSDAGYPSDTAAAVASAGTLSAPADLEQEDVDIDAALEAAGHAVREVMWFDYNEGREAWAVRIDPLCTPNGMALYNSVFFGEEAWQVIMEREYVTQGIDILGTRIVGEGSYPGTIVIEVTTKATYTIGDSDESVEAENTNQIVMSYTDDGEWLTDGPPFPPNQ